MASEDSDQLMPGLLAIHRLNDFRYVRKTLVGLVGAFVDEVDAAGELLEIPLLRGVHPMLREERNDLLDQVRPSSHDIAIQVLLVIVVPPIRENASHTEEPNEI